KFIASQPCVSDGECDDGNSCTVDLCDTALGCRHTAVVDGTLCDDGNACTLGDRCVGGICTPGSMISCPADDQCHASCDPHTGVCGNPPRPVIDGSSCDDGNDCTVGDQCEAGLCVPGPVSDSC